MYKFNFMTLSTLLFLMTGLYPQAAYTKSCLRGKANKRGKVRLTVVQRDGNCKKNEVVLPAGPQGETGASGPAGADGSQGADGADGQLRIYGDGSAGPKTVTMNEILDDSNLNYTDFTVAVGTTLSVPSGTVIRCTGTFTNNGTITILTTDPQSAVSGQRFGPTGAERPAHPGVSNAVPFSGEHGDNSEIRGGGLGGVALSSFQARLIRYPGATAGGGGGSGRVLNLFDSSAHGGGSLVVLCDSGIINNGVIDADGESGIMNGGGAGGIVILASRNTVEHSDSAVISAAGGKGCNADSNGAACGGGGIVHFLAPTIIDSGTTAVNGGSQGSNGSPGSVTASIRSGGGGGGACGGSGGVGGRVLTNDDPETAFAGNAGHLLKSEVDPTPLF